MCIRRLPFCSFDPDRWHRISIPSIIRLIVIICYQINTFIQFPIHIIACHQSNGRIQSPGICGGVYAIESSNAGVHWCGTQLFAFHCLHVLPEAMAHSLNSSSSSSSSSLLCVRSTSILLLFCCFAVVKIKMKCARIMRISFRSRSSPNAGGTTAIRRRSSIGSSGLPMCCVPSDSKKVSDRRARVTAMYRRLASPAGVRYVLPHRRSDPVRPPGGCTDAG